VSALSEFYLDIIMKKRFLIAGAHGGIGEDLAIRLAKAGNEVIAIPIRLRRIFNRWPAKYDNWMLPIRTT
jgi:NADP-dependent 3-hydroxy acid dehydrogenase YdfG